MQATYTPTPWGGGPRRVGAIVGDALRRRGGRRAVSAFSAVLCLAGIGMFAYPAATDLSAHDLQNKLNNARTLYNNGSYAASIAALTAFADTVKSQSGAAIPDVWQANGALVNVGGLLRSGADTLKYSLTVRANQPG